MIQVEQGALGALEENVIAPREGILDETRAVVEMAGAVRDTPEPELPRGYLTNPSTSPLAGVMTVTLPPASPIRR